MHVPAFAYPYCVPNNKEPDMRDVKKRLARLERLVLRDDQGRVRARLGIDGSGVLQRFFDATGTERIHLGGTAQGLAQQRLSDQQGRVRVSRPIPTTTPKPPAWPARATTTGARLSA